jgi:hypothetical protein
MMLLDILFTLFLTHVGSLTNVENNQRRFAPTPAHIERNYLPTSPEYAAGKPAARDSQGAHRFTVVALEHLTVT